MNSPFEILQQTASS